MLRLTCAALGLAAFLLSFSTVEFLNDHHGRISPGRQIARYGEVPFRDFLDPGYFMTEYSSAAVQWVFGDNLLGEALLISTFVAVGTVLVFLLAMEASQSYLIALMVAALALLMFPRAYDYDKVLFYPLGILLCWNYVKAPTTARVWSVAAGIVAGGLYRYDTTVFLIGASVVSMAIVHSVERKELVRRLALLAVALVCFALPFLLFVQYTAGAMNAADQIIVYGTRETARTHLSTPPRLRVPELVDVVDAPPTGKDILVRWTPEVDETERRAAEVRHGLVEGRLRDAAEDRTWSYRISDSSTARLRALLQDPVVEDTGGIDRARLTVPPDPLWTRVQRAIPLVRLRVLPGAWNAGNAEALLYELFRLLPLVAVAILLTLWVRSSTTSRVEMACVASLITLCLVLNVFILRDPVGARLGGMAGPVGILSAWIIRNVSQVQTALARYLLKAAVAVGVAATVWSVSVSGEWPRRLSWDLIRPSHSIEVATALKESPPRLEELPKSELEGVVKYLRDCTVPNDRILVGWFAPEMYFFTERGFAAGVVAFFGQHWSESRFQERSVQLLSSQSVPIAILLDGDKEFAKSYPLINRYLLDNYEDVGASSFDDLPGGAGKYRVFTRRDRRPTRTYAKTSMPCFA
jgi:hypothetical protein